LHDHGKEIYKNPPSPPILDIIIFKDERQSLPERAKNGDIIFDDHKEFKPNYSPEEVLRAGAFGGTYFRPIHSAVTNIKYRSSDVLASTVPKEWIEGLDKGTMITSSDYNIKVNKWKAKCGGSLGMWESSGWMSNSDPYGWFQWYCRFYQGRRCSDDERQISRYNKSAGPTGRFKSQLANKIIAAGVDVNCPSISPVIR